jgi:SAM-dependent methyltransferase
MSTTKESLEHRYEQHHQERERYGFSYHSQERGPQFAAWIGTGKRVLDLGCRDGVLTQHYVHGNAVTGVDIDQRALEMAKERLGIHTLWLDLNRSPLPSEVGSFDVVVAGEVLEHLVHPASLISQVLRVLTSAGAFIGSVPNSFHWRARLAYLRGRSIEDPTHLHRFSWSAVLEMLRGFDQVQRLPVGGIGGGMLPILPARLSQPLLYRWPALLANDFLFCARKVHEASG